MASLFHFFEMEVQTSGLYIKKMHTQPFLIRLFDKTL
jgi:hypothetical protein